MKNIVETEWNPFSEDETIQLTSALKLFIQVYYKQIQNKLQKHLENLKVGRFFQKSFKIKLSLKKNQFVGLFEKRNQQISLFQRLYALINFFLFSRNLYLFFLGHIT